MTARPIRYQRQVSDRKGKIFYTSITSLSHISKISGHETAHGGRRHHRAGHDPDPSAVYPVLRVAADGYSHRMDHGMAQRAFDRGHHGKPRGAV